MEFVKWIWIFAGLIGALVLLDFICDRLNEISTHLGSISNDLSDFLDQPSPALHEETLAKLQAFIV